MDAKPDTIKRFDNPRPLFKGEHWVDLAGGIAAWFLTRKHPSLAVRTLGPFLAAPPGRGRGAPRPGGGAGRRRRPWPRRDGPGDALDPHRRRHQARLTSAR